MNIAIRIVYFTVWNDNYCIFTQQVILNLAYSDFSILQTEDCDFACPWSSNMSITLSDSHNRVCCIMTTNSNFSMTQDLWGREELEFIEQILGKCFDTGIFCFATSWMAAVVNGSYSMIILYFREGWCFAHLKSNGFFLIMAWNLPYLTIKRRNAPTIY